MEPSRLDDPEPVPLGQRLMDRPFLLLAAGLLVMFLFYTGWGLLEILGLPQGKLP
jgi:hypothetical protein